jgi:hypothetical protein
MINFRKTLLAGASAIALLVGAPGAFADSGTAINQSSYHNDASTFWVGEAAGATSCNAVSATSPSDTITITPPSGSYVNVTALLVQINTDATGSTAVPTLAIGGVSSNGGIAPTVSLATTLATTGSTNTGFVLPFPAGGLRGSAPGTAVTFTPSATLGTHTIVCMSAVGFFSSPAP